MKHNTTMVASSPKQLHFILFPLMAQGHAIPMIDIAKLLARRGLTVTIIFTPLNAVRYQPTVARAQLQGLKIKIHQLQFSFPEAGLPEGCENFDMLPSLGLSMDFILAMNRLKPEFEKFMEVVHPRPSCIISDWCISCTHDAARKFGIPQLVFPGPGCFPVWCMHHVSISKILELNKELNPGPFTVPGLPDQIKFTYDQMAGPYKEGTNYVEFIGKLVECEKESYGIIVNTFEELEPESVQWYKQSKHNKVWCIGPVSLCNKDDIEKAERGNKTSIDENTCLKWLDSWEPSSVVYACLGSINNLTPKQMMELGLGLEATNRPFIWVIRETVNLRELKMLMLMEGFEERIKARGLLIWGWAPQVLILSHPSTGAFLTHCGWSSTLEGVCAGVPLITWPLFADQVYNEKLVVHYLDIGVPVGAEACPKWGDEEKMGVSVMKGDIEKAVEKAMDKGKEGQDRRKKVRELAEMARKAMDEGGSSNLDITRLIEDVMQQQTRIA